MAQACLTLETKAFVATKPQHAQIKWRGVPALDENRILIADTYNHKLKMLGLRSRTATSLAGSGIPGKDVNLNEPGGLAVLGANNNRIMSYDLRTGPISNWPVRH